MSFYFFATIHHWSWSRFKKGEFVEDESYEWRDAVLDRRLGVRIRETKYFIFFREIRYKQREHNYWIEKAGGWRFKIPFCKTYDQTRIGNWILVDLPLLVFAFWIMFSYSWSLRMVTKWSLKSITRGLKVIQNPQGKSRERWYCRYPSPDKTSHTPPRQQWRFFSA